MQPQAHQHFPAAGRLTCLLAGLLTAVLGGTQLQAAADETTADAALIEAGRARFSADCGFCHGRDAQGGSRGLDLTRSALVAEDSTGTQLGEVVKRGRADKGMPAFATLSDADISALSAYIHAQKRLAESAEGGRRSVEAADLMAGDAARGERYFAQHCSGCHDAGGDLAGVATRHEGLQLLLRMLNPRARGAVSPAAQPQLQVTTSEGQHYRGTLAYRDEFTVALRDAQGVYRSWPTRGLDWRVSDPVEAHVAQLPRWRDDDMHDVIAWLLTLR